MTIPAQAADLGDTLSQYSLGNLYSIGKGTEMNLPAAYGWYKKSADQGHASAIEAMQRLVSWR